MFKRAVAYAALLLLPFMGFSQEEARLLRFPTISGDQIVFSYAGDLYTVDKDGGVARRLTTHIGYEMFARISPDGQNIAFTGQYDGNTEVYVMPATGGIPNRATYTATLGRDDIGDRMGPNNIVMTWRDDNTIVFRSRKESFNSFKGQLFAVSKEGGISEQLPLPTGGFCSYSPDKQKLAYNQVFREFRTWKYYKGGMADDVWIYDFNTKETVNITNNDAQDIIPMWIGTKIYFLSDRDRTMNLFVYDTETAETRKVTEYTNYDIKFPSAGNNMIVYENGGYIYTFDPDTETSQKVSIRINNDFVSGRDEFKDASKNINSFDISPKGKRVVFSGRGDVWTVPVSSGVTRNLTETSGAHDRNVEWSPNGKYISFISDMTDEGEIYIMEQDGNSDPVQITKNSDTYKYNPVWSPNSKMLLWSDKKQRLQYVNVDTKEVTLVDETDQGEIRNYLFSPDNKWIAYTKPIKERFTQIFLYNLETKEKNPVTDTWYRSGSPTFSDDGKLLFFVSSRDFKPVYSWTEWNHAYVDMMKPYFVTLTRDAENPLKPENDEVEIEDKENGEEKKEEKKEDGKLDITVDFEGIFGRIVEIPVEAGAYWRLDAVGNKLYYAMRTSAERRSKLKMYDLDKKKETELGNYGTFVISDNDKKMLLSMGGGYAVIDLPSSKISGPDKIDLSDMKIMVNLEAEWNQIYDEAWRQMRDFFYDPGMHGVDWKQIQGKYKPLVTHVQHRNDLNYIIGEMIGELSVGHAYVNGGDVPKADRIKTGLLGAELIRDKSGYYKIDRILEGQNWTDNVRSPLTEIGVDVEEGDYIIAVNGSPVDKMENIYASLVGKAGKQVELTINDKPSKEGSHEEIVIPIADEADLYYFNWVQENIRKVDEATNGQIGYIHIPDMGVGGLNEFVKYYYPQLNKRGLIIDDRGNGGGNVSPMIIERLNRELTLMEMARNRGREMQPSGMIYGPKVLLIDQYSASDGDLFPYQFKKLNMGPLIGTRTWGGVVGIRGSLPFIDGGDLRKPEFAHYDAEGKKFIIEGHGVEPDIEVRNDPAKEYEGTDQQLNKAIEVILKELEKWPEDWPPIPPFPDKSK